MEKTTSSALKVAGRGEGGVAVELHTPLRRWKVYSVPSSEMSHFSAKGRYDLGGARLELDQTVEQLPNDVDRIAAFEEARVEAFGARFRAIARVLA